MIRSFINSRIHPAVVILLLGGGSAGAQAPEADPPATHTATAALAKTSSAAIAEPITASSTVAEEEFEIVGLEEEDYDLPPPTPTASSTTTQAPQRQASKPAETSNDQIVVTGSRTEKRLRDTPVPTELVTRKRLEQSGAEDLGELLEEHPGIELERSRRGSGIRMFGLNPEHTLILVDGQRTTGRIGGGVDPNRFDLNNVEQIEIVKGAGSALYGSEAIGGVINLISRRPRKPIELFLRPVYGGQNTFDITASAGTKLTQYGLQSVFTGGYHRSDGFSLLDVDDPDSEETTGVAYRGWNIENRTSYQVTDELTWTFRGDTRRLSQSGVDTFNDGLAVVDRNQRTDVLSFSTGPDLRIGKTGRFRAWVTWSDFRLQIVQDQRNSTNLDTFEDIRQRIGQLNLQFDELIAENHLLSLGVEGIYENQQAELIGGGSQDRGRAAAFIQDEWSIAPHLVDLQIVPSLRVDNDTQFGSAFTPRVALRYAPVESVILRANFGYGFRAPSFEELYLTFTNPGSAYTVSGDTGLEPERAQAFTVAAEVQPHELVSASVQGFWIEVDDLINTQRGDSTAIGGVPFSTFQYVNVASARSRGFELQFGLHPLDGLDLELGYVLTDTLNRSTGRELEQRARHKGTAQVTYSHPIGTTATLRSSFVGQRLFRVADPNDPNSPDEDEIADPFVTLDIRVEQKLFDHFTVFVGAENLFNVGHPVYLPTRPRSFYGGLSARYQSE